MNKYYKQIILACAVSVILLTAFFKFKTGSFIKISEKSKREVKRYEINKRKHDLTIKSLRSSCWDMEYIHHKIIEDAKHNKAPCVLEFFKKIEGMSADSAVYMAMKEMYKHIVFSEDEMQGAQLITYAFHEEKEKCNEPMQLLFEKNDKGDFLIYEVRNFSMYLSCACS